MTLKEYKDKLSKLTGELFTLTHEGRDQGLLTGNEEKDLLNSLELLQNVTYSLLTALCKNS